MSYAITDPNELRMNSGYEKPLEFQLPKEHNNNRPVHFDHDYYEQKSSTNNKWWWITVLIYILGFIVIYSLLFTFAEQISFSGIDESSSLTDQIFIVFGWSLLVTVLLHGLFFPVFVASMLMREETHTIH